MLHKSEKSAYTVGQCGQAASRGATATNRIMMASRYIMACVVTAAVIWFGSAVVSAQTQGVVTANKVNVRDAGSLTNSNVLYRVDNGEPVEILDAEGDYYKVNVRTEEQVYIAREYVKVTQADGIVVNDTVWLFEVPTDTGVGAIGMLAVNDAVTVTAQCGAWLCVSFDGVTGFVLRDGISYPSYLLLTEINPPRSNTAETNDSETMTEAWENAAVSGGSDGELADEVIAYAKQFLGVKYRYGSMSPSKGFDCSGFVSYVLKYFDITVTRNSASMAASNGVAVSRSELRAGDLVFFATSGGSRISHVGIYIGGGEFIHASTWGDGVVIASLNDKYYNNCYVKATRVL